MSQILMNMYLQVKIFPVTNVNCRLELLIVLIRKNLKSLRLKIVNRLIGALLNINSARNLIL